MVTIFANRKGDSMTREYKDKVVEETANYYEKTQISYDIIWMNKKNLAMHYGLWDENTKKLHDALINENKVFSEELEVKKGDRILDAGCGVGGTTIWIAENFGVEVTGITVSKKQVERAIKSSKSRKVDHLTRFAVMDYCHTSFADEMFDKIYAMESMCYAVEKSEFLKEMKRILKPGGILVVADVFQDGRVLTERDKIQLGDWLDGWAVPNVPILREFRKSAEDLKLELIEAKNMKKNIIPSARRIYNIGRIFYPFDYICNKLRLLSNETFKSTLASLAQYRLFTDDTMQYFLIKIKKVK